MGFVTIVHILNDGLDQIRKSPEEFVDGIWYNLNDGGNVGVGNHANCVDVMRSEHADTFQLVGTVGNLPLKYSRYDKKTANLVERRPDIARDMLKRAKTQLKLFEEYLDAQT